jgi:hypothetical protein
MEAMLRHIVEHGSPAQADLARELVAALAEAPDSRAVQRSAAALIDAFLHDPYLTR